MTVRKLTALSLSVLMGAFAHLPAQAAMAEASMAITGFTYRLIDLTPDDGVAASLTFHPTNKLILGYTAGDYELVRESHEGELFSGQAAQLNAPSGTAQVSYSNGAFHGSVAVNPENVQQLGNQYTASLTQYFGADMYSDWTPDDWALTLSANTALVIEAQVATSYSVDHEAFQNSAYAQSLADSELALSLTSSSYASMTIWGKDESWQYSDLFNAPEEFLAQCSRSSVYSEEPSLVAMGSGDGFAAGAGTLVIGIANGNDFAADLRFMFTAEVSTVFSTASTNPVIEVPVIPEPSTWALMGLGLLGVAAASRRQARLASH